MNSDLLVYCDNLDGTYLDFCEFPNYPKFSWFIERISPQLVKTKYLDIITPTVWYEDPIIPSDNPVIKKAMNSVNTTDNGEKGTCVYVKNFLSHDWTGYFNNFKPISPNKGPIDELNMIYFQKFYDYVKKLQPTEKFL